MKKSLILGAALLALGFVSCSEDNTLGIPQVNPQGPVLESNGVSVEFGTALTGTDLNLNDYINGRIPVIKTVSADELYNGGISYVMELATKEDFSDAVGLTVTDGAVSDDEWDEYFRTVLGRSPKAKPMYVRFQVYGHCDDQLIRIGGTSTYFAEKKLNVTPIPMDFVIEQNYYLIGTLNDWALSYQYPFKHSSKDVYDDATFSITVDITEEQAAAGWWWKVAPQTAVETSNWDGVVGPAVDGDSNLEGKLVLGKDAKAGCIKEAGTFLMTINMEEMTYSFMKLSFLYTPGNTNGWSAADSQKLTFNAERGVYLGFAHLNGEFKITSEPNWDGTNYGDGGDGQLTTDGGAGNLKVEEDGLYWLTVDLTTLSYTATKITSLGVIGGMNDWGGQEALTPSADFLTWTGDVTFKGGDEWKFRMNDSWDINLGGGENNLQFNGGNLPSPGAGTFTVTLNLAAIPYTCSTVSK